jgi:hypothetical protein
MYNADDRTDMGIGWWWKTIFNKRNKVKKTGNKDVILVEAYYKFENTNNKIGLWENPRA